MVIGIERQRQNYLQMIAKKEAQKNEKPNLIQTFKDVRKFTGLKLDETKKICDLNLLNGTRLNPLNPSAKVLTEEELAEIRRKQRDEQPKSTLVDGVEFTYKELKECENIANKAISSLNNKLDYDYEDYARMGIAATIVNSFASKNLTKEQAEVVNNSMEAYFNHLVEAAKEHRKNSKYLIDNTEGVGTTGELNKYYAFRVKLDENSAESFKKMVLESHLPKITAKTLIANTEHAVKKGSMIQCASNTEHAQKIKSLFQNMDIMDEDSVKNAFQEYEILMTPVYKAAGLQNSYFDTGVDEIIGRDIKEFVSQIASGKAAFSTSGKTIDFAV